MPSGGLAGAATILPAGAVALGHGVPDPAPAAAPPATANGNLTRLRTLALYQQGSSVEEIARERNLTPKTILNHLTELIEDGEAINVDGLVQPEHYAVIADALQQVGGDKLKPVKEFLGDEYTYDEIRLVRALIRQSR